MKILIKSINSLVFPVGVVNHKFRSREKGLRSVVGQRIYMGIKAAQRGRSTYNLSFASSAKTLVPHVFVRISMPGLYPDHNWGHSGQVYFVSDFIYL